MTLIFLVSAGSELGGQEQDSLDGHLVASPAEQTIHSSPEGAAQSGKPRRYRRSTKENDLSSSESDGGPRDHNRDPNREHNRDQNREHSRDQKSKPSKSQQSHQSKPSLKITMERAQSNFSQKSVVSKTSKASKGLRST